MRGEINGKLHALCWPIVQYGRHILEKPLPRRCSQMVDGTSKIIFIDFEGLSIEVGGGGGDVCHRSDTIGPRDLSFLSLSTH